MKYERIIKGQMHKRLNRFVAEVFINDDLETVHVKNTGRLKELLYPGANVILEVSDNPNRKTKYSIIAADKNGAWVNIDSQAPNKVAFEAIIEGQIKEIGQVDMLKREVTYGDSRFDLYYEKDGEKGFIEVKGVTLERDGVAIFPDAPTSRGTKHVLEMEKAVQEGYTGTILLVVQVKGCLQFVPNKEMDPAFTNALLQVSKQGVQILAYDTIVKEDELVIANQIPVCLDQ